MAATQSKKPPPPPPRGPRIGCVGGTNQPAIDTLWMSARVEVEGRAKAPAPEQQQAGRTARPDEVQHSVYLFLVVPFFSSRSPCVVRCLRHVPTAGCGCLTG